MKTDFSQHIMGLVPIVNLAKKNYPTIKSILEPDHGCITIFTKTEPDYKVSIHISTHKDPMNLEEVKVECFKIWARWEGNEEDEHKLDEIDIRSPRHVVFVAVKEVLSKEMHTKIFAKKIEPRETFCQSRDYTGPYTKAQAIDLITEMDEMHSGVESIRIRDLYR
jgi:hypothetical protein